MNKILHLTLKKKWFDMIKSGEKKEEYRKIKAHWCRRLLHFEEAMEYGVFDEMIQDLRNPIRHEDIQDAMQYFGVKFREYDEIIFKNGYKKDSPKMKFECTGVKIGRGKLMLGAPVSPELCFIIGIGERKEF